MSEEINVSVGDYVRLTSSFDTSIASKGLEVGDIIKVVEAKDGATWFFNGDGVEVDYVLYYPQEFQKVDVEAPPPLADAQEAAVLTSTLVSDASITVPGLYRPELEARKVGKVPLHMVFDGFPHALQHVAEIMGWAEEKKGYKLHDWKNLPGAAIEFPAANYRHANDNSKQKSLGITAQGRVDHESAKLHIGHQIFNLLAELELVLTGKIQ